MDRQELVSLKRRLNSDKRMAALHKAFSTQEQYNLPLKELYEEVTTLHTIRKTRALKQSRNETFVQKLMEAMIDDMSKRSRLVEILMLCVKTIRTLEDLLEDLEGYLLLEYGNLLYSLKTKGEREQFIKTQAFAEYLKYTKRLHKLKEACEFVIVDIDKGGYTYRNLVEAAKLSTGTKHSEL